MTKAILPKGSSCSTCKARKVRCDAIRPACTACKRSARFRHENPDEVECCYTTTRRASKREDGVLAKERIEKRNAKGKGKGKEVSSTSDEEDHLEHVEESSSSSMSPSITSNKPLSSDRDTWTTPLPPFSLHARSESDPSQSLPSYESTASASTSPTDDFSFPLDLPVLSSTSLPLPSEYLPLADDMFFESSSSFYPTLSISPSKLFATQLLIPRQDFDVSFAQQDPFLSSPSSVSSSSYPSSLSSFDGSDHPFALADELSFYHSDSSVPPSPPFSPSIEPAKENFDFSHCFLPDANGFESLTLPLFQPYPSGPAW